MRNSLLLGVGDQSARKWKDLSSLDFLIFLDLLFALDGFYFSESSEFQEVVIQHNLHMKSSVSRAKMSIWTVQKQVFSIRSLRFHILTIHHFCFESLT